MRYSQQQSIVTDSSLAGVFIFRKSKNCEEILVNSPRICTCSMQTSLLKLYCWVNSLIKSSVIKDALFINIIFSKQWVNELKIELTLLPIMEPWGPKT